jgi:primosomal replication protein N
MARAVVGSASGVQGQCEVELDGYRHQCRLDSISRSGAEVNCMGFLRETSRGDVCALHLQDDARQKQCRVIDIAGGKLHLRFMAD